MAGREECSNQAAAEYPSMIRLASKGCSCWLVSAKVQVVLATAESSCSSRKNVLQVQIGEVMAQNGKHEEWLKLGMIRALLF